MLTVNAKDFGPIVEGSVELRPLTVFLGPSNSGKSCLATLIYSLLGGQSRGTLFYLVDGHLLSQPPAPAGFAEEFRAWVGGLVNAGETAKTTVTLDELPAAVRSRLLSVTRSRVKALLGAPVPQEIERCFGPVRTLPRRSSVETDCQFALEQGHPHLRLGFRLTGTRIISQDPVLDTSEIGVPFDAQTLVSRSRPWSVSSFPRRGGPDLEGGSEDAFSVLADAFLGITLSEMRGRTYYLPAARSGIAQGHKALAAVLVRQSPLAGIEPLAIPTLSGVVTDFIGHILTMGRDGKAAKQPLSKAVEFFERRVVKGRVDLQWSSDLAYPEINYAPFTGQPTTGDFPLHRTSSMVSELAPMLLFLKYLVRPGDRLTIEEPESHLHPALQLQMARGIVRLVNSGVKVLVTTHSDYLVGQFNNLMRLQSVTRPRGPLEEYSEEDRLDPEKVAAYDFRLDPATGSSVVVPLTIAKETGIPEEEFTRVAERLYSEALELERQ